MYKKICDRCGKEITERPVTLDMISKYWYEIVKYEECGDVNTPIHLCNACLAEFERFLSGEHLVGRTGDPLNDLVFKG